MAQTTGHFTLKLNRLTLTVFGATFALVLVIFCLDIFFTHQFQMSISFRRIFVVTYEESIGSWYSVVLAAAVAAVLWLHVLIALRHNADRLSRATWIMLAVMLTYASVDDGAKIHERVGSLTAENITLAKHNSAVHEWLSDTMHWFPSYSWQLVYLPILMLTGVVMLLVFVRELKEPICRLFIVGGLGCFVVAVGIDFMEGVPGRSDLDWFAFMSDDSPLTKHYFKAVEECLEMTGMGALLTGFLRHLTIIQPTWSFEIDR